jgi:hypothetical protein
MVTSRLPARQAKVKVVLDGTAILAVACLFFSRWFVFLKYAFPTVPRSYLKTGESTPEDCPTTPDFETAFDIFCPSILFPVTHGSRCEANALANSADSNR